MGSDFVHGLSDTGNDLAHGNVGGAVVDVGKLAAHEVADFAKGSVQVAGTLAKAAGKIAFDDMKHLINDTPVGWVAKPIAEGLKKGFKVLSSGVSDVVDDIVHINYTGIEHAVAKGFKDAGEGLKNAGEAALHGAEVVGKDVGHAATTVGKDVGHAASSVVHAFSHIGY